MKEESHSLPDLAENSLSILLGYYFSAAALGILMAGRILEGMLAYLFMGGMVLVMVVICLFARGLMHRSSGVYQIGRFAVLFVAVARTIATITFLVLNMMNDAEGIAVLPGGEIGYMVAQFYGGQNLEIWGLLFFLLDFFVTIAAYVAYFALSSRRTRIHFEDLTAKSAPQKKKKVKKKKGRKSSSKKAANVEASAAGG